MDNRNAAPVIPAGTNNMAGAAYNPLQASYTAQQNNGQATPLPDTGKSQPAVQQVQQSSETNAPLGTTFEELAAKKGFRTPEDLAKAYAELESQNKRVEMGLAELVKLREESDQQPPIAAAELNQVQTQDDAIKVVERIVKKVTRPLEDKLALQELFYKNPDATQYASEMAKLVKENPGINWDVAYKAAKFDTLPRQAAEKARQEAYQAMQQKQAVAVGTGRPGVQNARALDDLVKDKSIPFAEVTRIMRERFSQ